MSETRHSHARRTRIALCLSGGGYRAALFHLGAVRRLNELGILAWIDTFSCVSGGSILGAFLAQHVSSWPGSGPILGFESDTVVEALADSAHRKPLGRWRLFHRCG